MRSVCSLNFSPALVPFYLLLEPDYWIQTNPLNRFVEIMATVFSRDAWRCVWHMIQVRVVHPFCFMPCAVRERCRKEWAMFQTRLSDAEKAYYLSMGIPPPNSTVT
ncbi:hypothetical protein B296_00001043 [Ensete ventricosum]|uniref:Uncharacterized protein n=1 Tax=Ensete ventricosum TaxID=4639 RepID=A0A427B141_ENSVE|nr:hypothetical protein B296_00001043 [Ensete ventricosum]